MIERLLNDVRPFRLALLASFDLVCWVSSFVLLARLEAAIRGTEPSQVAIAALVGLGCGCLHVLVGFSIRLHQGRAGVGSFDEALLLVTVAGIVFGIELVAHAVAGPFINELVVVTAPVLAFALMIWGRGLYRVAKEQGRGMAFSQERTPVLVVGAGDGGRQLIWSMLREPDSRWRPAGIIDDDPLVRHRRIANVPVLGPSAAMGEAAHRVGAGTVIIAIPTASSETIRTLSGYASEAKLEVKVVPGVHELMNPSRVELSDVRDIDVTDLLGRHVIDTDVSAIAGCVRGKRVLVTGAGGSIGSELCRQIARFGPSELMMLDRDESALHAVQLSIYGKAMLDQDDTVLCDIRDARLVAELFTRRRPQVVFHAAALKHLPLLERAPGEAVKTNVWGTLSVLEAAAATGVERFVNISTDKAANPCSVLGYSKRLAEGLTAAVAPDAAGTYLSVRFGNVLGSRGSVLTAFAKQIAAGGPVTVTDPEVTRYFMTIEEAVQLVIQAAAIGRDGEALILDMGQPVSIESVARQLIDLSGKKVDVQYTGLRAGEKLHEELFGFGESDARPRHPLISHTRVPCYDTASALALDAWDGWEDITTAMREACEGMLVDRATRA